MTSTTLKSLKEVRDNDWVRQAFFIPGRRKSNARDEDMDRAERFSDGKLSFADTSLGGNQSINPRPQFTLTADPKLDQITPSSEGMGRTYHEVIDANAQRIYMQFGVPQYNSLTNFFGNFYDSGQGRLANTGATGGLFYTIGKLIGYVTLWPVITVLGSFSMLYKIYRSATRQPLTKYYYVKPTMSLYWTSVTTIVNALGVNLGLIHGTDVPEQDNAADAVTVSNFSISGGSFGTLSNSDSTSGKAANAAVLNKMLPDIYGTDGGIDIRMVANRYQRLANAHNAAMAKILDDAGGDEAAARERVIEYISNRKALFAKEKANRVKMADYLAMYSKSTMGKGEGVDDTVYENSKKADGSKTGEAKLPDDISPTQRVQSQSGLNKANSNAELSNLYKNYGIGTGHGIKEVAVAELRDGSAFISYVVDYQDNASESFSNSTTSSTVADQMNEKSSDSKNTMFNMAGGNFGDGMVMGAIETVANLAKDVLSGALDSIGLSGLGALGGAAFTDIPDFWDSSSTQLTSTSYTIQLRTPYGNSISIMQNILIPLATLLAAAAPRSTGPNSYTAPYLCKLWHKGRAQVQLGIIDSLSITRGTGNVGWNAQGLAMGIDVTFSVTNLSKMLHMPITTEFSLADAVGLTQFDEDNNFTDYMATLGALGLSEQHYNSTRWRLRRLAAQKNFKDHLSMSHIVTWAVGDTVPGSIMGALARSGDL